LELRVSHDVRRCVIGAILDLVQCPLGGRESPQPDERAGASDQCVIDSKVESGGSRFGKQLV
jgi:hypothetical protein